MAVEVNVSFSRVMDALADTTSCAAADSSCQPQQDLLPAYVDVAAGSEDGSNASELQQSVERTHRRSASCSAIMEPSTACLQDTSLSGSHASLTSAASTPAAATDTAAEGKEKRCHKHKHRHHHHHNRSQQQQEVLLPSSLNAAGERMVRSASVDDSHSSHASSGGSCAYSNTPALIAVVEERRPKSFTVGTLHRPHHLSSSSAAAPLHHGHSSSSVFAQHAAGSRAGSKHVHSSGLRTTNQKQQELGSNGAAGTGRRSPLQQALHSKHHAAAFGSNRGGYIGSSGSSGGGAHPAAGLGLAGYAAAAAGVAGSGGSFTGGQLVLKVQRVMSESVKPEAIAKGFAGNWLSRRCLDVFTGVRPVAATEVLRKLLPSCPGLHLWLVKPPRSRHWVPVHIGAADKLRQGAGQYLHDDGSVGPSGEPWKYRVLLDLMCRGFAVQIRFRPAKARCGSLTDDLCSKLARFDFPLNDKDNGGCRPIELPNGWPVNEFPIICGGMNELYEELFGPRRML